MRMRILVTGSKGFLGGNLYRNLIVSGEHDVISHSRDDGDLCDPVHVKDFLAQHQPTHIWHVAATPTTKLDETNFSRALLNNIQSTQNLLHFTPKGCHFLFPSSVLVYGETRSRSYPNKQPRPISVYGTGKLACENLIRTYNVSNNINYAILRLCAVVGPNMTHGLLPDLIRKYKTPGDTIELFGDKPGASKPFIHSDQVYDCLLKESHAISTGVNSGWSRFTTIYNISPEDRINVGRIASLTQQTLGLKKKKIIWRPDLVWKGDNRILSIGCNITYKIDSSKTALIKAIKENADL